MDLLKESLLKGLLKESLLNGFAKGILTKAVCLRNPY